MARSARRTPQPQSLLDAIAAATAAYVGQATTVGDEPLAAEATRGRGSGFRITVEVTPERAIFGPLPAGPQRFSGEVSEAPGERLTPGEAIFPPDTLHETPYWAYARAEATDTVLVVAAEEPVLRLLSGAGDPLVDAVALVHGWVTAGETLTATSVMACLSEGGDPAAGLAGFARLLERGVDPGALLAAWMGLPGLPDAARAGAVAALPAADAAMTRLLAAFYGTATGPETLVALARALSAQPALWSTDPTLAAAVRTAARRARQLTFEDRDGAAWQKRVAYQAELLQPNGEG